MEEQDKYTSNLIKFLDFSKCVDAYKPIEKIFSENCLDKIKEICLSVEYNKFDYDYDSLKNWVSTNYQKYLVTEQLPIQDLNNIAKFARTLPLTMSAPMLQLYIMFTKGHLKNSSQLRFYNSILFENKKFLENLNDEKYAFFKKIIYNMINELPIDDIEKKKMRLGLTKKEYWLEKFESVSEKRLEKIKETITELNKKVDFFEKQYNLYKNQNFELTIALQRRIQEFEKLKSWYDELTIEKQELEKSTDQIYENLMEYKDFEAEVNEKIANFEGIILKNEETIESNKRNFINYKSNVIKKKDFIKNEIMKALCNYKFLSEKIEKDFSKLLNDLCKMEAENTPMIFDFFKKRTIWLRIIEKITVFVKDLESKEKHEFREDGSFFSFAQTPFFYKKIKSSFGLLEYEFKPVVKLSNVPFSKYTLKMKKYMLSILSVLSKLTSSKIAIWFRNNINNIKMNKIQNIHEKFYRTYVNPFNEDSCLTLDIYLNLSSKQRRKIAYRHFQEFDAEANKMLSFFSDDHSSIKNQVEKTEGMDPNDFNKLQSKYEDEMKEKIEIEPYSKMINSTFEESNHLNVCFERSLIEIIMTEDPEYD